MSFGINTIVLKSNKFYECYRKCIIENATDTAKLNALLRKAVSQSACYVASSFIPGNLSMSRPICRYRNGIGIFVVILLLMVVIADIKREAWLQAAIKKAKVIAKENYNSNLIIGSAQFTGLSTIELSNVIFTMSDVNSFHIKKIELTLNFSAWLFGNLIFNNLVMEKGNIAFNDRDKLEIRFDSISSHKLEIKNNDKQIKINGDWTIVNLLINHPAIASNDIKIPHCSIQANLLIDENEIYVDRSSEIKLQKITLSPSLKYTYKPKTIEFEMNTDWLSAQDLFDSIPKGVCNTLEGLQVKGKLQYALHLYLNFSNPHELAFDSKLDEKEFKIVSYGKNDLSQLNTEFVYTPYEKVKPRLIGLQNPDFTSLKDISSDLRNAVIAAEDILFYTHQGFDKEAIKQALAFNLKEKKFKVGASTISMQIVKNAFLNREKTLVRKLEEILVVWLIENTPIMTKDRLLEVYLNIIEWGNDIYGISEASRYYFSKRPSELTLGESIYLASIIPRPKEALTFFLPDGVLHPKALGYFNKIGYSMVCLGATEPSNNVYGFCTVRLNPTRRKTKALNVEHSMRHN
jgi:hypothetical protein